MRSLGWLVPLLLVGPIVPTFGQARPDAEPATATGPDWLLPVPELRPDKRVPTLRQVVGHAWARDISNHAQIERYVRALAAAAPDRTRLETYARSFEGRPLYYLVISSPENMKRLDAIRANNLRLSDPRRTTPDEARERVADTPALVWLAYGVHGNETSSCDAALITAYHLLADQRGETRKLLEDTVVFIDPMENPDGRERFINVYRETRGSFPDAEPFAAEHTERWPGGRFNHYLYDMNRDWFLQSQRETRGRVTSFLHWMPHIYVDAHEMGRDAHYYFDPPMDPINDLILPRQRDWFQRLGRQQAARFDQYGFPYTTREMFDAFYPGYGSTWPTMHGSIGILWEQAGVRGLVIGRSDETRLHYHDAVRHHYVSGLATIELAARHRAELVGDFYQARSDAVRLGRDGPVHDFFLLAGKSPSRAAQLARLLERNGIEVRRVAKDLRVKASSSTDDEPKDRAVPAGSYHVPVTQPGGRLARILLDRHADMGKEFVKRQLDRLSRRLGDEIYDVTAWSLPLAFDVPCVAALEAAVLDTEPLQASDYAAPPAAAAAGADSFEPPLAVYGGGGAVLHGPAKLAYLVSGDDAGVPAALAGWLRQGLRVHVADQPLLLAGSDFPRGTLILRVAENPATLHATVTTAARRYGLKVHATDTGWVTRGAHLGGPEVRWVKPPRVALVVDRPASYTVGHTWYLFDHVWQYPVTRFSGRNLAALDLSKYNVLVLPDGGYSDEDAPNATQVGRIREWVRAGGTLILVKGAASWATGEKVALLATKPERRPVKGAPAIADAASTPPITPTGSSADPRPTEPPDPVSGAFLHTAVYDDHWVTFGCNASLPVMMNGNLIFAPLGPTDGRNLVTFAPADRVLASGFCWPDTLRMLAGKPYLLYQALGEGHIVAFADDPNFRSMFPATQRLFYNAFMFGPGH
jgi:hypothetical protein